jgi:agmatine/peptidylarginine deiminase
LQERNLIDCNENCFYPALEENFYAAWGLSPAGIVSAVEIFMKKRLLLFAFAMALNPLTQSQAAQMGLLAEHVQTFNTLALSLVDTQQPIYGTKLQILKEFLKNSPNPRLIFLVSDDRDIQLTNDFIRQNKADFNWQAIRYIKNESIYASSSWMRDFSPVMIQKKDGTPGLVLFKYVNDESDYKVDQNSLTKAFIATSHRVDLRLEGGNILSDEDGRLYISTAVVENNLPTNSTAEDFTAKKAEIEKILKAELLASEVVWIPRVAKNFEATGHVDMYMRLLNHKQAIVAESNNKDINKTLNQVAEILQAKGFQVTRLKANDKFENKYRPQNVFPSYTNSILVGKTIFIPEYHVPEDTIAVQTYRKMGYKVIQIEGDSIQLGGSVHCLTYLYP